MVQKKVMEVKKNLVQKIINKNMKYLLTLYLSLNFLLSFAESPVIASEGTINQHISASRLYLCRKEYDLSEEMALKAIKLAESLPKNKYFQAKAYANFGIILAEERKFGAVKYLNLSKATWAAVSFVQKDEFPSSVMVDQKLMELENG